MIMELMHKFFTDIHSPVVRSAGVHHPTARKMTSLQTCGYQASFRLRIAFVGMKLRVTIESCL